MHRRNRWLPNDLWKAHNARDAVLHKVACQGLQTPCNSFHRNSSGVAAAERADTKPLYDGLPQQYMARPYGWALRSSSAMASSSLSSFSEASISSRLVPSQVS